VLAAERAHASLSRYFSPQIAAKLARDGESRVAVERRDVAALFTDITGFTSLVETTAPEVLGAMLNEYMAGMTDLIFAHDGTVAKIIGDAIHALFNAPGDQRDYAARAVSCACRLDAFAQDFMTRWREKGLAFGITRIGVHAGPVLVGNFGGGEFFDYTAYGDTINTAARLEVANKTLGTRICVSGVVVERAGTFSGRPIGNLMLRGRAEALAAFEPLSDASQNARLASYIACYEKLANDDPQAMTVFAAHLGTYPDDALARFHLKRLLNAQRGTCIALE
jgi:adenylate cyclase